MNSINLNEGIMAVFMSQLYEVNRHLNNGHLDLTELSNFESKSFLFGFDIEGSATAEEYRRYYIFLELINNVLREFGIHIGNNGYSYIVDSVKIIIDRKDCDIRLKSDIYPLIAVKYGVRNLDTVEHSIRNAINTAYNDCQRDPNANKMHIFNRRPTNKTFLKFIAQTVLKCVCETKMELAG